MRWPFSPKPTPRFKMPLADCAREMAAMGAAKRRAEHRLRRDEMTALLATGRADPPLAPTEGWR